MEKLKKLRSKVFGKSNTSEDGTGLTAIVEMARGLSCLPDIIGREYEIKDSTGRVVYTISQKPMTIKQLNTLLKEFNLIRKKEDRKEAAKFGGGSKNKTPRLNKRK